MEFKVYIGSIMLLAIVRFFTLWNEIANKKTVETGFALSALFMLAGYIIWGTAIIIRY